MHLLVQHAPRPVAIGSYLLHEELRMLKVESEGDSDYFSCSSFGFKEQEKCWIHKEFGEVVSYKERSRTKGSLAGRERGFPISGHGGRPSGGNGSSPSMLSPSRPFVCEQLCPFLLFLPLLHVLLPSAKNHTAVVSRASPVDELQGRAAALMPFDDSCKGTESRAEQGSGQQSVWQRVGTLNGVDMRT